MVLRAVALAGVFFAAVLRVPVTFFAAVFLVPVAFFAVVLRAGAFLAAVFVVDYAGHFFAATVLVAAGLLAAEAGEVFLAGDCFAVVFVAGDFLAAVFFAAGTCASWVAIARRFAGAFMSCGTAGAFGRRI